MILDMTNTASPNNLPGDGYQIAIKGHHGHGVTSGHDSSATPDGYHLGGVLNGHGVTSNGLIDNHHSPKVHANVLTHDETTRNALERAMTGSDTQIPIAVCGMGCRLPGGLTSPDELWDFLLAKRDGRCRVPESRYNIDAYYSRTKKPGTVSTQYGYFLDESVELGALDMSFFSMTRSEVERADPQQRLMLEVAQEAFEDAGVTDWRGKTIGTYIGNFGQDWADMLGKETQPYGVHGIAGAGDFVVSNRLSYEFDLQGPRYCFDLFFRKSSADCFHSMTIRTACSSALVALNEACSAIDRGDCESALVGGVNLILAPAMSQAMQEQGVLSADGSCKTFSAEANGYARGEAATAIFIKPLADALRDGNPVQAVIRATSHNVDGKTPTMSQPSTDAQEALIRRAYALAGIDDFCKTAMVECHGTGTVTGDPIEAKAVARVFGDKGVYIGSVKPNIGHTEGASGMVSLLKMVKALQHRTIPPNIRFGTPNPQIPFKEAKLSVPTEPIPWPEDRLERVSINSFGIGGANAHVVLESAASYNVPSPAHQSPDWPQLLLFTANSSKSFANLVDKYKQWIERNPDKISDLAYTLARKRRQLPHRAFGIVNNGVLESVSERVKVNTSQKTNIVMVFTGQGAQWPQMGRELLQSNQVFRSTIRSLDQSLQCIDGEKPSYSIEEELKKPGKMSRVASAEFSQPLCTAVQIALVDALRAVGVHPDAVIGHSSGEIAAAKSSGRAPPSALFFSSVTGELLDSEHIFGPQYWQDNLESPVRFREAVLAIMRHDIGKNAIMIEIGPHGALAGPLRQISVSVNSLIPYVPAMARNQDCTASLLAAIGALHSHNASVNLDALFPTGSCLLGLPRYPFNHEESYWFESRLSKEWRNPQYPYHDLLGRRVAESSDTDPLWRNLLHISNAPWLRDHKVGENIVFPFCGYISVAGEAIRQVANADQAFVLRNILVSSALILSDGKPTEMMTTFSPHRLTDTLDSQWWNFTISAYNGRKWTKHCTGQVSALSTPPPEDKNEVEVLPRRLIVWKWFEKMAKGGLNLGPAFQTLETMATSTKGQQATGHVINGRQGDELNYYIHPTVLDSTLQILGAAAVNGYARKTKTWLPTAIDQIKVYKCASNMVTRVSASLSSNHSVIGDGYCTSGSRKVVEATGIRMSPADGTGPIDITEGHAASRCEWKPDVDFMNIHELFHAPSSRTDASSALRALGESCLRLSQLDLAQGTTDPDVLHLKKYVTWIESQVTTVATTQPLHTVELERQALMHQEDKLLKQLARTPAGTVAAAINEVSMNLRSLLAGNRLEDVLSQGSLDPVYAYLAHLERKDLITQLVHSKPNLRILEIGTSKGVSIHREVLQQLTREGGEVLCAKYTLTTPGFLAPETQEKLFVNMNYASLDIEENPLDQGFNEMEYDLVIAVNVLHETRKPQESLANMKRLLQPHGRLYLQELTPSSRWVDYLLGTLPLWWSSTTESPVSSLHRSREELEALLTSAGFDTPEAVILDAEPQQQLTTTFITKPISEPPSKRITVLLRDEGSMAQRILNHLARAGFEVTKCNLADDPPSGQDVLALLDLESAFLHGIEEADFLALKKFLLGLHEKGAGLLWATHLVDIGCQDPRYGQVLGFARSVRTEQLADFATCQVDDLARPESIDLLIQVLAKFQARQGDDELNPDYEWAIFNDRVQIARFHPFVLGDELLASEEPDDRVTLDVGTPGRINSLHYARHPRGELEDNEVEVQVYSAGLNFRDVLVALGIVELPVRLFGVEAAGVITRIGADVRPDDLQVGDRVFCFCRKDAFSTYTSTLADTCVRIPDSLCFDQAGTMLIPYVTAIYSLINVGRVTKGQTVLIHSACGGVGLAAIQVARMLEAEVYVTVGNQEKVEYLMDNYNIPRNRIFNSRDKSFVDGVMRETNGRGMDFILNSLSGELLHATWTCVATYGTLLEIGKRDYIGGGKLDMKPFLANRNCSCIDVDGLWGRVHVIRALLLAILEYYDQGYISPLPAKMFSAAQTQDAFRYMEKGLHIGRIGLTFRQSDGAAEIFQSVKRPRPFSFNGCASYLMVGGLGGLGRAVSTWMVDHGAREIIYMSRTAGLTNKDQSFVQELQSMGCTAKLVAGDVCKIEDVRMAMAAASFPLKGIVQMTMVVANENFTRMSRQAWAASLAPKVQGTWNLHNASVDAKVDLDFFLLFSSVSGIVGQAGQANYASGNSFLDAFAQYRNDLGLPASVVDMGAVEDAGWISEQEGLMGKMARSGFKPVLEQEVIDSMAVAMLVHNKPEKALDRSLAASSKNAFTFIHKNTFLVGLALLIPLHDPSNYVIWKKDRRMASYHNKFTVAAAAASTDVLKSYLKAAQADPSMLKTAEATHLFAVEIGRKLLDLLLRPQEDIKISMPLVDLGLDSLVALELRAWIKQVFSFDIPVLEMMGIGSLEILGQHAANEVYRFLTESSKA
ncbi:Polyketide synthase [Teratosphaeria destructans]|uniref:Polyketide synthase n=1 Tax=Teratosphaeria destructans TaxID=418781 RepID=A0A9W7SRE1_9PEZI|nr:Polyketide synthase [Teratosphaeria destructans]